MPMICIGFLRGHLHLVLAGLFAIAGVALLLAPEPVEANVTCNPRFTIFNFGSFLEATGSIVITCNNHDNAERSFTMCGARTGSVDPNLDGQPQLRGPNDARLNFNLYVNPGDTIPWSNTNLFKTAVILPANALGQEVILVFHGKIPPEQPIQAGSYQAHFHDVTIGFLTPSGECMTSYGILSSNLVSIQVNFQNVAMCALGTIEPINFGQGTGTEKEIRATGWVNLQCPYDDQRPWTLKFGSGNSPSGEYRRMQSASGDAHIDYRLYRDLGHSNPIPIDGTITDYGTGARQSVPVYGVVNFASMPAMGSYSDRVLVTLSF